MTNIDNLTFGELKQITAIFNNLAANNNNNNSTTNSTSNSNIASPFIGKYCIARCYAAGVHAGEVVSVDGETVVLKDSRRLWSWEAADGVALSGVAQKGFVASTSKVDTLMPLVYLTGVAELLPCIEATKTSITSA